MTAAPKRHGPPGGPRAPAVLALAAFLLIAANGRADFEGGSIPADPRYVFRRIGDDAGMATRGATSMFQDRVGFMWFGTQDGLFRYDGAQIRRYGAQQGVSWASITQLVGGPDKEVWVVAEGSVARFDGTRFHAIDLAGAKGGPIALTLDATQAAAFDSSANLYLATAGGLARLEAPDYTEARRWSAAQRMPEAPVRSVHVAPDGMVWFGARSEVWRLDPVSGDVRRYSLLATGEREDIVAVLANAEGSVWVRTRNDLFEMSFDGAAFEVAYEGIAEAANEGMPFLDRDGDIMVPSRSGLFYEAEGGWELISSANGLPVNAVWSVFEDRERTLWFGLGGAGVCCHSGRRSWSAWTEEEGLPDNGVWGMLRDRQGRLWVGTNRGVGIWLPDEGRWRIVRREDGLFGESVWKIVEDSAGRIWSLSRRLGVTLFDPDTLVPRAIFPPMPLAAGPTGMIIGPDGAPWISGNDYLFRIAPGGKEGDFGFEPIDYPDWMAGCTEVLATSGDGTVWTGGRNGLGRFADGRWTRFTVADGLVNDRVEYLLAQSSSVVWVDYRAPAGVTRFALEPTGAVARTYDTGDGLVSDTVFMLGADRQGQIWVGTADGLSVISPDGEIRGYDTGDGLIWNDISQEGFLAESDGAVFIGTGRGLAHFWPTADEVPTFAPTVVLTSATLGGEETLGQAHPRVAYQDNTLVVKYSGLVFRDAARTVFRYRLYGLEESFVETNHREVRFPALPPGTYRFEVMCETANGLRSARPAAHSFTVLAPWWRSWWARLAAAAVVVAVVFLVLELRTRKLARDRRRLEAAVAQRSAELAEANRELREMSFTDALTHVRNRRFFSTVIDGEVGEALRMNDPRVAQAEAKNRDLAFYMVDLDFFKRVNDVHGHMVGDSVLVETARRLALGIRKSDLLVRWGGEEFLLVCRNAKREEGDMVARRILSLVGEAPFEAGGQASFRRSCSVGWAIFPAYRRRPGAIQYTALLELADKALYRAKELGRNRAVGVEIIEDAFEEGKPGWLDAPLTALEGTRLELRVIEGPAPTPDPDPRIARG